MTQYSHVDTPPDLCPLLPLASAPHERPRSGKINSKATRNGPSFASRSSIYLRIISSHNEGERPQTNGPTSHPPLSGPSIFEPIAGNDSSGGDVPSFAGRFWIHLRIISSHNEEERPRTNGPTSRAPLSYPGTFHPVAGNGNGRGDVSPGCGEKAITPRAEESGKSKDGDGLSALVSHLLDQIHPRHARRDGECPPRHLRQGG